jgi:hypothetical protein
VRSSPAGGGARGSRCCGNRRRGRTRRATGGEHCVDLVLHERESDGAVLDCIALVRGCVAAVAAVGVRGVTVRLDVARERALEAGRAGRKLRTIVKCIRLFEGWWDVRRRPGKSRRCRRGLRYGAGRP